MVLFGIANYFSFRHYQRWDVTPDKKFTLSDFSKKVLKSLRKNVEINVVFVEGSRYAQKVNALVDDYDRARKARVVVNRIDPIRNPSDAEALKLRLKIENLDSNMLIITSKDSMRIIKEEEMLLRAKSKVSGEIKVVGFRGEEALTSALLAVTEREKKKVYFLRGKGNERITNLGTSFDEFTRIGSNQNLDVQPLDLPGVSSFPEDTHAVILPGVKYDLSERELAALREYWDQRKGSLLVLLNPGAETPRLNAFIRELGIERRFDRVMWSKTSSTGIEKFFDVNSYFMHNSPITEPLLGTTTSFGGQTCSLGFPFDESQLQTRGLQVIPLLRAADDYWGETNYLERNPIPDNEDNRQPLFVAASVERGGVKDPALRVESARMVVVGNSSFMDPDTMVQASSDFITNALNWLLDREQIIGIPPESWSPGNPIPPDQESRLFLIACILLPGAVLALGMFNWSIRRT